MSNPDKIEEAKAALPEPKLPPRDFQYPLGGGVCARYVCFNIVEDDRDTRLSKVFIQGGCSGNTAFICRLLDGMTVNEAIKRARGIKCADKNTSCPDQLARVLIKHQKMNQKPTPEEQLEQMSGQISHLTNVVLDLEKDLKGLTEAITQKK